MVGTMYDTTTMFKSILGASKKLENLGSTLRVYYLSFTVLVTVIISR